MKKTQEQFEKEVFEQVGNEYTFLEPYKGARTHIGIIHNECGWQYKVTPDKFLNNKRRCSNCNGGVRKTTEQFKVQLKQSYGDEIELVGEYINAHTPTQFYNIISDIRFESTPDNVLTGKSLGRKISNGEFLIMQYLKEKEIIFDYQFKFEEFSRLSFDFYIPKQNILIEFDGEQHYKPVKYFGEEKFKRQKINDEKKNKFCSENNITLIRIPYWEIENIEQLLNKYLD